MKKLAFLFAGAAALALTACGDAADDEADTAVVETETTVPAPVVTETTVVEGAGDTVDGDDSVTVDEEGVEVDIDENGAEVEADIDTNP